MSEQMCEANVSGYVRGAGVSGVNPDLVKSTHL